MERLALSSGKATRSMASMLCDLKRHIKPWRGLWAAGHRHKTLFPASNMPWTGFFMAKPLYEASQAHQSQPHSFFGSDCTTSLAR